MDNLIARASALLAANGFLLVKFGDLWEAGKLKGGGPVFAIGILATTLAVLRIWDAYAHQERPALLVSREASCCERLRLDGLACLDGFLALKPS